MNRQLRYAGFTRSVDGDVVFYVRMGLRVHSPTGSADDPRVPLECVHPYPLADGSGYTTRVIGYADTRDLLKHV